MHATPAGKYGARKKVLGKAALVSLKDPGTVYADIEFWLRVQVPIDQSLRLYVYNNTHNNICIPAPAPVRI